MELNEDQLADLLAQAYRDGQEDNECGNGWKFNPRNYDQFVKEVLDDYK